MLRDVRNKKHFSNSAISLLLRLSTLVSNLIDGNLSVALRWFQGEEALFVKYYFTVCVVVFNGVGLTVHTHYDTRSTNEECAYKSLPSIPSLSRVSSLYRGI